MEKIQKTAVFSFYNTPSGRFSWWDSFPQLLTQKLEDKNVDHFCFYREFTEESTHPKDEQFTITTDGLPHYSWLLNIHRLSRTYDSVIFHTHSFYPPLKIWILTLLSKNRVWITTEHRIGSTSAPTWKMKLRAFLRKLKLMPKTIVCVSNAVAERNTQLYGDFGIVRIHNGICLPETYRKPRKRIPKKALYVGRLDKKKGIWNLLKAFRLLHTHYKRNDIKLCVVGGGGILNDLKAYVRDNDLNDIVEFAGYQPDPEPFYSDSDFVIIPTIVKEACPLVALEARCHGLPVLYSNKGGLPETVVEGKSGMPLSGLSAENIAESVNWFVNDERLYNSMLESCRDGLEYFSIDRMTDDYIELYLRNLKTNNSKTRSPFIKEEKQQKR
ncbi:glycosyltransferase family 4 protein [Motiliproteus sp. MSK22-1]|uniref:glycosyltransferase family 4 protein n=1 Tax=Motiliproteus sp. MSK22-1 TaxID=1897630 RepID=UPI000975B668|nr:glycosyltransferase family 4 protein [Motiliproteus sp. MSK22-1]OMH38864.1 hypothetical protein BGP75_00350 [Motiliproteus sp. MSK22-1]